MCGLHNQGPGAGSLEWYHLCFLLRRSQILIGLNGEAKHTQRGRNSVLFTKHLPGFRSVRGKSAPTGNVLRQYCTSMIWRVGGERCVWEQALCRVLFSLVKALSSSQQCFVVDADSVSEVTVFWGPENLGRDSNH